jgi:hypothetical protein
VDETDALRAQGASKRQKHLHSGASYKRLERGRFRWPERGGAIGLSELTLLLEGVDLRVARLRRVEVQRVD